MDCAGSGAVRGAALLLKLAGELVQREGAEIFSALEADAGAAETDKEINSSLWR